MKISIFGVGYVGLTSGACLADLGHEILCVDIIPEKINLLKEGKMPFYEPGLKELVHKNREKGRLCFTTDTREAVDFGEVIFNCVGTPSRENGEADLKYVFQVAEEIGKYARGYKILINKSTVPPGTARQCEQRIKEINPDSEVEIVANPEFLREGQAIRAFNLPDKIVVGARSEKAFRILKKIYSGRMRIYLPIVETDWETAELIKYANNTFLAAKISFINEIANICERVGADVKVVAMALGMDYRISPRFLNAGVGYGGSCFPKDVRAIAATAREHGYTARLFEEVVAFNERQKKVIVEKIEHVFHQALAGKTFSILGLSFKPKTSDMREAPSIVVINELLERGAQVRVYDPEAMGEARKIFKDKDTAEKIIYCSSPEEAAEGGDALVILTEWDEFRNLDLGKMRQTMRDNKLFDGRNIYEPELAKEEGFEYYGMGRC